MKTQNWFATKGRLASIYADDGTWIADCMGEENAHLCAAAPFMREMLERIATLPAEYVSEQVLNLAKDALAACEVRKEKA